MVVRAVSPTAAPVTHYRLGDQRCLSGDCCQFTHGPEWGPTTRITDSTGSFEVGLCATAGHWFEPLNTLGFVDRLFCRKCGETKAV